MAVLVQIDWLAGSGREGNVMDVIPLPACLLCVCASDEVHDCMVRCNQAGHAVV